MSRFSILRTTSPAEKMRQRLSRKLAQFTQLAPGWSFGDGVPVTEQAMAIALDFVFLATLLGVEADVFPNLDGGCAVTFYSGEESVEVSVSDDGSSLGLRVERGIGFEYDDLIEPASDVAVEDVYLEVLHLVQDDRWKSPVSFTSYTSIQRSNDSEIQPSSIQENPTIWTPLLTSAGGSQSSKLLVPAPI